MVASGEHEIPVPPFKQIMASEEDMDQDQRRFYATWVRNWRAGRALGVQGNISYLFCFVYEVLGLPPDQAVRHLTRLVEEYSTEEKFIEYCRRWLSDCHVLLGDYRAALASYPPIPISSRAATCTDDILNLKVQIGEHIAGRDVLTLNGPRVTAWGKKHISEVGTYLDIIVSAYEKNTGVNLLEKWKVTSHHCPYFVFRGTPLSPRAAGDLPFHCFSTNGEALRFVGEISRDAENTVREEMDIPRVGEGWVAETELYYRLKEALGNTAVLHHASPDWLGQQHLDVFVPEYSVGLEFQGTQHDTPVEYFGGEEAFQATKRRDAKKKHLCSENGVRLLEVRPGYDLSELVRVVLGSTAAPEEKTIG